MPSEAAFWTVAATGKFSDVISGVIVDPTGVKVPVNRGYSRSNRSRDTRLPHFVTNDDNDDAGRQAGVLPKDSNYLENRQGRHHNGDRAA